MAAALLTKDLHRGFALRQRRDEVGLGRLTVRVEITGAYGLTFAEPSVDDDAVQSAKISTKCPKNLEHLVVIIDVEAAHDDAQAWMLFYEFVAQCFQTIEAACAQGEISPQLR